MQGKTPNRAGHNVPESGTLDGTLVDERILSLLSSGLYPAQIARKLGIRRNRVSRVIQRMEKSGIIEQISEWPKVYKVLSNDGNKVPPKFNVPLNPSVGMRTPI